MSSNTAFYTLEVSYLANVQKVKSKTTPAQYEIWFPLAKTRLLQVYNNGTSITIPGPKLETLYKTLPVGTAGTLRSENYLNRSILTKSIEIRRATGSLLPFYGYANKTQQFIVIRFETPGSNERVPQGPWSGASVNLEGRQRKREG